MGVCILWPGYRRNHRLEPRPPDIAHTDLRTAPECHEAWLHLSTLVRTQYLPCLQPNTIHGSAHKT